MQMNYKVYKIVLKNDIIYNGDKMKKRKLKYGNIFLIIILLICSTCLILSIKNIIKWNCDNKKINEQLENINDNTKIKEKKDNKNTKIINNNTNIDSSNPYWNYIKMNLMEVDFKSLYKKNNDTIGWIQVNGTNINYPIVQANNNDYYLTHSFNKKQNDAGWIFLDYRNNINIDKNVIIYGHGRMNTTMFGSLKNILKNGWLKNKNNYIVKLSTKKENTLWQVFSVYKIHTTNDYLKIEFNNNSFKNFTNTLIKRSNYNFNTNVDEKDRILTLSTCYNDKEKVVLHAKLIKKETR